MGSRATAVPLQHPPRRGASPRVSYAEAAAESRILIRIAIPIILSQLGAVGMTAMDTIMVGPLGAEALAAVGLGSALHMALMVVTTGTLFGMAPLVSQAFGRGDRQMCRRVLMQGLWVAGILMVPMFALNTLGEPIALLAGQDPDIAVVVGEYMGALAWGVPPLLVFMAIRQFLEGMSLTKPAMVLSFIGLGLNFIGNWVFIYGVGGIVEPMGPVGAGWTTSVVRWGMLLGMIIFVVRHPDLHPFRGVRRRIEGALLRRIIQIGMPTGIQVGLELGLFTFAAVMMGWFGAVELGTHQVTLNIAATTFMVALGLSFAGSIRVGQTIGAGERDRTRLVVLLTYAFAVVSMATFSILFLTIPERLIGLYTDDPQVIALGVSLLFMAALFQVFDGAQIAGFSVLRGAADTRVPMMIAAVAYWGVGATAAYFLAFHTSMGPPGIWAGLVMGLVAATFLLVWRVRVIHWPGREPAGEA